MCENINDAESKTEKSFGENPPNKHRTELNETTLVSDILNVINKENFIIKYYTSFNFK